MNLTMILGGVLAVSALANAALTSVYLGARDDVARVRAERDTANGAALSCSKATDRYREAAENRAVAAEKRAAAAQATAKLLEGRADGELSRQPAVPGDACASAQVETDEWVAKRRGTP